MKKANVGLIIAAGSQKRFNNDFPKALVDVNGTCLLDINYNNLQKYCDRVYVVCSFDNEHYFDNNKYKKIVINSGYGSGDAIYRALKVISYNEDDNIFIIWGDALINEKLYELTLNEYNKNDYDLNIYIPCTIEKDPYVQLLSKNHKNLVLFSKYDEQTTEGFHDMCVFLLPQKELFLSLKQFYNKFYDDKLKKYVHKHGNEFEFLDIFNDTDIKALYWPIIEDIKLKTLTFNTQAELDNILKEV